MKRKRYDNSFKEEAVKLSSETSVSKAAQSLGLHENTLRNWIKLQSIRADNPYIGSGNKYISPADVEKAELIKKNRELERANTILKEALSLFVKGQKK